MFVVRTQISQNQDYPEKAKPGLTQNKPNYLYQNKLGYINDQSHSVLNFQCEIEMLVPFVVLEYTQYCW